MNKAIFCLLLDEVLNDLYFMAVKDSLRVYELEVTASTQKGVYRWDLQQIWTTQGRICLRVAGFNDTTQQVDLSASVCSVI